MASIRSVFTLRILCEQNLFIRSELTTETNIPSGNGSCRCFPKRHEPLHRCCAAAIQAPTSLSSCAELQMECTRFLPPGFIPHTVLFPLDTPIPILSMGIPSLLIKYCNASAPAYYDSIWFVTRTRHSRSSLLDRIFITRGRRTVYSPSAWLVKETVRPLPSHYNKNKHSLRGFIYASGAMLILYHKRKRRRLSRQMLADLCGLTRSAIARYERGERFPTIENLVVLADFFDTSIDSLIGRK